MDVKEGNEVWLFDFAMTNETPSIDETETGEFMNKDVENGNVDNININI